MSFIDLLNFNLLFNLALKNVSRVSNHGKINSFVETKRFFVTMRLLYILFFYYWAVDTKVISEFIDIRKAYISTAITWFEKIRNFLAIFTFAKL